MAQINLLPWRVTLRQYQKKQYLMGLAAIAIIVGLIGWFVSQAYNQMITHQNQRNQFLEKEIAILDAQIAEIKKLKDAKHAIEQRMVLIEQLQKSRNVTPIVFDELARIVPAGVSFKSLRRVGNRIEIEGLSESNNRLSEFMRRLESSDVFTTGVLSSVVAGKSDADVVSDFKLTFNISISDKAVERRTSKDMAQ